MSNPKSSDPTEESSPPVFSGDRPSTLSDAAELVKGVGSKAGEVLSVLTELLEHMQMQNKLQEGIVKQAQSTNQLAMRTNKRVVAVIVIAAVVFGMTILVTYRIHQTVQRLETAEINLLEVKRELQESLTLMGELNKKATSTTNSVAKIEEQVQDAPKLVADNKTGELKLEVPITKHQVNIAKTRATPKPAPTPPVPVPEPPKPPPSQPAAPTEPNGDEPPKAVIPIPGSSNLQF